MVDISVLVLPLIAGVLLGYFMRQRRQVNLTKITFGIILVLIFSLGFSIGSNNALLESIPKVGLSALVISVLTILFSVLFVGLVRRKVKLE
jgi:uncharacterized membrane protein YbjE (DUF340 family)